MSTSPHILKSPSLKLYVLDQPIDPNFFLPCITAWKNHKPNNNALNSLIFAVFSNLSGSNNKYALLKFALKSYGASFATLIQFWRILSGIIFNSGNGGGYDDKNTLN